MAVLYNQRIPTKIILPTLQITTLPYQITAQVNTRLSPYAFRRQSPEARAASASATRFSPGWSATRACTTATRTMSARIRTDSNHRHCHRDHLPGPPVVATRCPPSPPTTNVSSFGFIRGVDDVGKSTGWWLSSIYAVDLFFALDRSMLGFEDWIDWFWINEWVFVASWWFGKSKLSVDGWIDWCCLSKIE